MNHHTKILRRTSTSGQVQYGWQCHPCTQAFLNVSQRLSARNRPGCYPGNNQATDENGDPYWTQGDSAHSFDLLLEHLLMLGLTSEQDDEARLLFTLAGDDSGFLAGAGCALERVGLSPQPVDVL